MKTFLTLLLSFTFLMATSEFDEVKSVYLKSYDYERIGNYEEALKVLSPLYTKYPKGYTLNLRFGWLFYLNKQYSNSESYYKKSSLISTYSIESKLGLARVYLATASYKKAQTITYEILKMDFYNYYANFYTIQTLIAEKKYDIAKKIVFKMFALYPTDILFLEQLAHIYKATQEPKLKELYESILILDPNNVLVNSQRFK